MNVTEEDLKELIKAANIRSVKKRSILKAFNEEDKKRKKETKSLGYLLPNLHNDIKNKI